MKAATFLLVGTLSLSAFLAGCTSGGSADHVALLTSEGCIVIELYPDDAPKTVENFVQYVEDGFYEGTVFHRIMQTFMIQGGGFDEDGTQKQTRAPIPLEYGLPNEKYMVSMARTSSPNSATSQFFINTADNTRSLGPGGASPDGYAVFGKVIEGQEVVDTIAAHPVGPNPNNPREISDPEDPVPQVLNAATGQTCPGAGETEPPPPAVYGFDAGPIRTAMFDNQSYQATVSNATDYYPIWVRNLGNRDDVILPKTLQPIEGWDVSFNPAEIEVQKQGAKRNGGSADAATAYLTIRFTGDAADYDEDVRIVILLESQNDPNQTAEIIVKPVLAGSFVPVTQKADQATLDYRGTFDNGDEFDAGTLPPPSQPNFVPIVAGSNLVPGFAMGLLGLAVNETVGLRFPPELGYGNDNPPDSGYERFNNQWLNFEITLKDIH